MKKLDEHCQHENVSREQAVFDAVVQLAYRDMPDIRDPHVTTLMGAFGSWSDMEISSDEYLKRIRAEWDRNSVWDEEQQCYVSPEGDDSGFLAREW